MNRNEVLKMYEELNEWVEIGIGDDILNEEMRPEYQPFVQEQREKGVSDEEIPQQVLWGLREILKEMPIEEPAKEGSPEVSTNNLGKNINLPPGCKIDKNRLTSGNWFSKLWKSPPKSSKSKVVISVGNIKIEVFE